jgi:hypothetical protein
MKQRDCLTKGRKTTSNKNSKKSAESTTIWNTVNELTQFRVNVKQPINVFADTDNTLIYDVSVTNDILANEFVVNKNNAISQDTLVEQVKLYEETYDYSKSDLNDIAPIVIDSSDVVQSIQKMKNKLGGYDQFPSVYVIKSCLNSFSTMLC